MRIRCRKIPSGLYDMFYLEYALFRYSFYGKMYCFKSMKPFIIKYTLKRYGIE